MMNFAEISTCQGHKFEMQLTSTVLILSSCSLVKLTAIIASRSLSDMIDYITILRLRLVLGEHLLHVIETTNQL
jgi:hypothetical protein